MLMYYHFILGVFMNEFQDTEFSRYYDYTFYPTDDLMICLYDYDQFDMDFDVSDDTPGEFDDLPF
jgi:hypothetical protein